MPKYEVSYKKVGRDSITIYANSKEEAIKQAKAYHNVQGIKAYSYKADVLINWM